MRVIKSVSVLISGPEGGIQLYQVGFKTNELMVSEIKNVSSEYEDHVHSEFLVKDEEGGLIAAIENFPVIVEWMEVSK